ncbi:MAG: MoxR family ATPase, partial [Lachnospiraceae bacterium]|nr:MoxR family ATPase [Lachnospiraceae bacterium]
IAMREEVSSISVKESILGYIADLVEATREEPSFVLGASPRAMLALVCASQARAFLQNRDYVKPDDVKAVAMQVLGHRLSLSSEAKIRKEDRDKILKSLILKIRIPV